MAVAILYRRSLRDRAATKAETLLKELKLSGANKTHLPTKKTFDSRRSSNRLVCELNEGLRGRVRMIKSALGFFVV
jgi:hypothetical protein